MLALYVVLSELENKEAVRHKVAAVTAGFPIVEFVSNILEAEAAVAVHRDATDGSLILVASGGTEAIINQIVFQTAKPALVWANPENNSLAAALEAYAALKARFPLKIVYSPLDAGQAAAGIESFSHTAAAIASIDRGVVGCLGAPSPWLLTSHGVQSFRSFKTRVVSLKLDRLLERYDLIPAEAAERVVAALRAKAAAVASSEQDLINSARLYLAMKDLAEEHNLTALTIRCYDLLDSGLAPCLGVSLCNDEGLVAGCEGDLEGIFTMILSAGLNAGPSWMADMLRIDRASNTLTLSHCTVPPSLLADAESARLNRQPDFRLGATIQGPLRTGPVTLLRIGGSFGHLLIASGRIIGGGESAGHVTAEVELNGCVESWLERAPGNHHVLLFGDVADRAIDFCAFKHLTPVII